MATPAWMVSGQYYETCSCDFVCPCLPGQLAVNPSRGSCTFAMAFQIDRGRYGSVSLDGLGFIVLGFTPEAMGKGNWSVGLIADERASVDQREAITAIASGAAGGPMSALSGLIATFLGVESAPIRFDRNGAKWSVKAASMIDMAAEAAMGINPNATEQLHLDNTDILPRIASHLRRMPRRATCMRSAWPGTISPARTTDSTRRFPGRVLSSSPVAALSRRDRLLIVRVHCSGHDTCLGLSDSSRSPDVGRYGARKL